MRLHEKKIILIVLNIQKNGNCMADDSAYLQVHRKPLTESDLRLEHRTIADMDLNSPRNSSRNFIADDSLMTLCPLSAHTFKKVKNKSVYDRQIYES